MPPASDRAAGMVHLSLYLINVPHIARPGRHLVTFDVIELDVADAAAAWLAVRGYDRAARAVDDASAMLAGESPSGGFHVTINKPNAILVFARWPEFEASKFLLHKPELAWLVSPNGYDLDTEP